MPAEYPSAACRSSLRADSSRSRRGRADILADGEIAVGDEIRAA
jgi:hypothetical protein